MTHTVTIRLPSLPPSANALTRNVPGKGRAKTKEYCAWIDDAGWTAKSQRAGRIHGRYGLSIKVQRQKKRRDLGNVEKAVSDLLTRLQIIDDDSLAEWITLRWSDRISGVEVNVMALDDARAERRAA